MKIVVRIPEEAYAFHEVTFDSIKEYEQCYPEFMETKRQVKKLMASTPEEKFAASIPGFDEQPNVFPPKQPRK